MAKHTPGPWTFEVEKRSGPHLTATPIFAHGDVIGEVYRDSCRDNSQANARLIAAAPELLAALHEALSALVDPSRGPSGNAYVIEQARAAIAKTTQA